MPSRHHATMPPWHHVTATACHCATIPLCRQTFEISTREALPITGWFSLPCPQNANEVNFGSLELSQAAWQQHQFFPARKDLPVTGWFPLSCPELEYCRNQLESFTQHQITPILQRWSIHFCNMAIIQMASAMPTMTPKSSNRIASFALQ